MDSSLPQHGKVKDSSIIIFCSKKIWRPFFLALLLLSLSLNIYYSYTVTSSYRVSTGQEVEAPVVEAKNNNQSSTTFSSYNKHVNFGKFTCGEQIPVDQIPQETLAQFEMVYGYNEKSTNNKIGHNFYFGPMSKGVELILYLQVCSYTLLNRFWDLAKEHNITRWSAHGGALMGAMCHSSINPWDDDIDITVSSCDKLNEIWDNAGNVSERYPSMKKNQYFWQRGNKKWDGRLVDDNYILIKGDAGPGGNWFKLKSVAQINTRPFRDLSGMDIQCLDDRISKYEKRPMRESGYRDALTNEDVDLQVVEFGPTKMMLVPDNIGKQYVLARYKKKSFCNFPLGTGAPDSIINNNENYYSLPHAAAQLDEALSKWYISPNRRNEWLSKVGKTSGNELNMQVPNMDHVEIDNSIALPESCRIGSTTTTPAAAAAGELNVVGFNAGRGTYWAEFASMIETIPELNQPDLIIMSEMDIGMARSGNIHTTRKLAYRLKMNYAWGLEFVELTNGNKEEQDMTKGKENALGLHGNAILSRCPMYDPKIYRDVLDDLYFSNRAHSVNAQGTEKRLGGRMGLYVRTGPWDDDLLPPSSSSSISPELELKSLPPHVVVGSVHKLKEDTFREEIWEYQGFGTFPNISKSEKVTEEGISQYRNNNLGVISSGDLASRGYCRETGLRNLDLPQKHKTFPANCEKEQLGLWRGDFFCGDMKASGDDVNILPCYNKTPPKDLEVSTDIDSTETLQISDHSIIQIRLKMNV